MAELIYNSATQAANQPMAAIDAGPISVVQPAQGPVEVRYRIMGINVQDSNVTLSETFSKLA